MEMQKPNTGFSSEFVVSVGSWDSVLLNVIGYFCKYASKVPQPRVRKISTDPTSSSTVRAHSRRIGHQPLPSAPL